MKKRFWWTTILSVAITLPLSAADPDLLLRQYSASDVEQRIALVDQWGRQNDATADSIAVLQTALRDGSAEVRWRAARALSSKGNLQPDTIAALVSALQDTDAKVRTYAAYALGNVARGNAAAADASRQHGR